MQKSKVAEKFLFSKFHRTLQSAISLPYYLKNCSNFEKSSLGLFYSPSHLALAWWAGDGLDGKTQSL